MNLTNDDIFGIFRATGCYKEGHFVLTSGRHSDKFYLFPHIFQYPAETEHLCAGLAARFDGTEIETVIGPATGGIILAYEVARQLANRRGGVGPRAIFAEKTEDGKMALKRQWSLRKGEKVLVVEDALTTGGSVNKTLEAIAQYEPEIVGVACLADRSGGKASFPAPLTALVKVEMQSWAPEECPLCKQGVPLTKPKA